MENISQLENSKAALSVMLRKNYFAKDGTYYTTVSRNKATFKNILAEVAEDNKGLDPFVLQMAAIFLQKKIIKLLSEGKAVNVLDLGTMYIAMKCKAKGKSDVPESGKFYIKFSPTKLVNDAVSKISVDKIVFPDGTPEINEVIDVSTGSDKNTLTSGKPCIVEGGQLKIGGEGSGIWFAPVEPDGTYNQDESTWTKLEDSALFRNKPKELNFIVPNLASGSKYVIILRTSYLSNGKTRKELQQSESKVITIN